MLLTGRPESLCLLPKFEKQKANVRVPLAERHLLMLSGGRVPGALVSCLLGRLLGGRQEAGPGAHKRAQLITASPAGSR